VEAKVNDLAPKNKALLAKRDELQAKIDAWHQARAGQAHDAVAYKAFLKKSATCCQKPQISRSAPRTSTKKSPAWPARNWWCR
jgi:malate synthase